MYSHEIDQTLKSQNYNVDADTYLHICNSSPQVAHVKYDQYSDSFELWTNDHFFPKNKCMQEGKQIMITLFRMFRCWQLRTKWQPAIWQFIDKQAMELIKSPEKLEKKFVDSLVKVIHESNKNNLDK